MEIATWLIGCRRKEVYCLRIVLEAEGNSFRKRKIFLVLYSDQEKKSGRMILPSKVVLRYSPVAQGDVHLLRVYFSRPSELEVLTPDQDESPTLRNKADGGP
jgi:hypothetical protein